MKKINDLKDGDVLWFRLAHIASFSGKLYRKRALERKKTQIEVE